MTDTHGDKIFSSQVPNEWISRKIDLDYGLDKEIEIVINGKLTGKTLLVQLKSTHSIDIADDMVRFPLETDKLSYYMERDVPVLFVLVDVNTQICYTLFIQEYVYEKLDTLKPRWRQQKSVVLNIQTTSTWVNSIDAVREIALSGPFYLAIKKLSTINTETTLKWKTSPDTIPILEEFARSADRKALELNLDLATRYSRIGEAEKSYEKLLAVYTESKADPKIRVQAIEGLIWVYNPAVESENRRLFGLASEGSELADSIGDKPHALYLRGVAIQAVFFKIVNDLTNEKLLEKVSHESKSGTEFLVSLSILETSQTLTKIAQDFVSNMHTVETERCYTVFTDLLRRHAEMMLYLYQSLVLWVDRSQIEDLLESAETSLNIGNKVCEYMKWEELQCIILDSMSMLYHFKNDLDRRKSVLEQFKDVAKRTGNKGLFLQAEMKSELYAKAPRFITGPKDLPHSRDFDDLSDEEIDQMQRRLLKAGGIDPDGKDELSQLARIGLRDRNPERVLKHCEHLYVEVLIYGPIWDMVGLPTTGTKLLYCQRKDCFLEAPALDELLREFKEKCCSRCDSHSPRPSDWKWNHRWQRERQQPEKMKFILKKYREL